MEQVCAWKPGFQAHQSMKAERGRCLKWVDQLEVEHMFVYCASRVRVLESCRR